MSLKMNFMLPKSDMVLKKVNNINRIKIVNITWKVKELPIGNKKNLYRVLSLDSKNVSFHDLKKAYRAKALKLHPDVCASSIKDECTKQFVELREAYEVLSDPNSRRMYDLSLVESMGCGLVDHAYHEKRVQYSRMVWEMQLKGLKHRSERRNMDRFV